MLEFGGRMEADEIGICELEPIGEKLEESWGKAWLSGEENEEEEAWGEVRGRAKLEKLNWGFMWFAEEEKEEEEEW